MANGMEEVIALEKIIRAALPKALHALNHDADLINPLKTHIIDAECIMLGLDTTMKGKRLDRLRALAKEMEMFL
jgi:hypothetical protein